jgi:hypothetical protein
MVSDRCRRSLRRASVHQRPNRRRGESETAEGIVTEPALDEMDESLLGESHGALRHGDQIEAVLEARRAIDAEKPTVVLKRFTRLGLAPCREHHFGVSDEALRHGMASAAIGIQLTGDHILNACRRVNYASSMRHGTAYDEEVGDFSPPSATSPTYRSFAKE